MLVVVCWTDTTCAWLMCVANLELFFQRETSLQTVLQNLLRDWKLVGNFCAFPDDHWVTAIQELVSKHEIFLPMLHHILCARDTSRQIKECLWLIYTWRYFYLLPKLYTFIYQKWHFEAAVCFKIVTQNCLVYYSKL